MPNPDREPKIPQHIQEIIQQDKIDVLIEMASNLASRMGGSDPELRNVTNTQIRNVYASVKRVASSSDPSDKERRRQIQMLLPRLHYAKQRADKLKPLADELAECIHALQTTDDEVYRTRFKNFADYLEAIVAYHYKPSGKH